MKLALVAAALLAVPSAAALDALPSASTFGALDARVVVRAATGASLHVETDAPALVRIASIGANLTPTPARVTVPTNASWHGLPGVVELELHRADAQRAVRIDVDDGTASGASFEWPAHATPRAVPAPPIAASLAVALALALALRSRGSWRGRQPPAARLDRGRLATTAVERAAVGDPTRDR